MSKLTTSINISNRIQFTSNAYSSSYFNSHHITNTTTGFYYSISGTLVGRYDPSSKYFCLLLLVSLCPLLSLQLHCYP